jgi:hypothetical protein
MKNIFEYTIMKTIKRMKNIVDRRIIKRNNLYFMLKNVRHNDIMKGIKLLTESDEEQVRAEDDKQIIRLEEDLAI